LTADLALALGKSSLDRITAGLVGIFGNGIRTSICTQVEIKKAAQNIAVPITAFSTGFFDLN
jgi:hypothetical protein